MHSEYCNVYHVMYVSEKLYLSDTCMSFISFIPFAMKQHWNMHICYILGCAGASRTALELDDPFTRPYPKLGHGGGHGQQCIPYISLTEAVSQQVQQACLFKC